LIFKYIEVKKEVNKEVNIRSTLEIQINDSLLTSVKVDQKMIKLLTCKVHKYR